MSTPRSLPETPDTQPAAVAALHELLREGGVPPQAAEGVTFTGDDPVLATPYRIGAAGAAAAASTGVAAARLWLLRTGRQQRIGVDVEAAALSLRGHRYFRIDGEIPPDTRLKLTGHYQVRDGRWVYLHCNFPHLRDRNLAALGAPPDPAAIALAARKRDGLELEDALMEGGGCGGLVRTIEEWKAHPHGRVVGRLPVLEISRIGDAPPEALPPGDRPLAGIRVLDLTRVIAGPICGRILAEHGADVLKITSPNLADSGPLEFETGIGKLSAYLDLSDKADAARLRELAATGDIFSQAFRPGALASRGFGPEELASIRPGIIYVSLSAWGHEGPWSLRRGYDTVVQAANGMAAVSGSAEKPGQLPVAAIDYITGNLLAFGAMAALHRRATEGGSWLVRLSLARVGHWIEQRGMLEPEKFSSAPGEIPASAIPHLFREIAGPAGRVRYLGSVVGMSETQPLAARPPVPPGHSAPEWPLG